MTLPSANIQIQTRELRLDFGELTAVNNLNLNIHAGEIYGLVGPNGAGKTSLLRMLASLLIPTYGDVSVGGIDLVQNPSEAHGLIGYMPDLSPVAPDLKVWEFLEYFAAAYGIPRAGRQARVNTCLDQVGMLEYRGAFGNTLSRGMTQKVVLAKTLLPQPRILLLDEPASGMDPIARINLKHILTELSCQGVTTIISSHILSELEDMCSSVGIMDHGKLLRSGTLGNVLNEKPKKTITLTVLEKANLAIELITDRSNISSPRQDNNKLTFELAGNDKDAADLLCLLIQNEIPVVSFRRESSSMEETLISVVNENKRQS